jgi:hypothetical protein
MNRNPMKISAALEVIGSNSLKSSIRHLEKGKALRIDKAQGKEVLCVEGELWVTQAGDPTDYLLESGQRLNLGARGPVVVSAIGVSSFVLA